jgi:hypothetical protein
MIKQGITIITLKNREDKCDNKKYETKGIYKPHAYILTPKNE